MKYLWPDHVQVFWKHFFKVHSSRSRKNTEANRASLQ